MKKALKFIKRQFQILIQFYQGLFYSMMLGCLFGVGILTTYETFGNKAQDVTSVSLYYPFAIFAACASICFSWVRAVDTSQNEKIDRIRICAEGFLLSAILFLISSLFKYLSMHPIDGSKSIVKFFKNFLSIMNWVFPYIFIIAYLIGAVAMYRILILLIFKRVSYFKRPPLPEIEESKNNQ